MPCPFYQPKRSIDRLSFFNGTGQFGLIIGFAYRENLKPVFADLD